MSATSTAGLSRTSRMTRAESTLGAGVKDEAGTVITTRGSANSCTATVPRLADVVAAHRSPTSFWTTRERRRGRGARSSSLRIKAPVKL